MSNKIKIQFTVWSPKINNRNFYSLFAKNELDQPLGSISYRLVTNNGIIKAVDVTSSEFILSQVVEMAKKEKLSIDVFLKPYTKNIKRYESNGKLSKQKAQWLEINPIY